MRDQKIQIFRALAIIAVVMIHTTPPGEWQVFCKPFINFAVAAFIFLSGYLTKAENDDWMAFYRRRIMRVAVPYVIWTVIYSLFDMITGNPVSLLKNLLSANANVSLYYIFVYVQFVLLTPLIGRLAKSRYCFFGWLVSPVSVIIFKYYGLFAGVELNKHVALLWSDLCIGWFTFYYLGMMLGNNIIHRQYNLRNLVILYVASIVLQMGEGYVWSLYDMAGCGSQLKLSALLTSAIAMLIMFALLKNEKWQPRSSLLTTIGDNSFGIYLCHLMVMELLGYIPYYSSIPFPVNSVIVVFLSLSLCRGFDIFVRLVKTKRLYPESD